MVLPAVESIISALSSVRTVLAGQSLDTRGVVPDRIHGLTLMIGSLELGKHIIVPAYVAHRLTVQIQTGIIL